VVHFTATLTNRDPGVSVLKPSAVLWAAASSICAATPEFKRHRVGFRFELENLFVNGVTILNRDGPRIASSYG
jgi:hypothetical protein